MEPRRRRVVPAPAACSVSNYCRSRAKSAAATLPFTDSSGVGLHRALAELPTAAPWRAIRRSCLPAGRLRRSAPSSPPRPPLVSFPLRFPFHVVVLPAGHWFRLAVLGALRDVVLRGARAQQQQRERGPKLAVVTTFSPAHFEGGEGARAQ